MMQLCLASLVVVLGVVHGAVVQPGGEHNVVQMDHHRVASMVYEDQWRQYKQMFGKSYSDIEDGFRRDIFAENLRLVQEHYQRYMNGEVSFLMDINRFSDMEHSEFVRQMNGYRRPANRTGGAMYMSPLAGVEVPDTVDWRNEGYVTPVKNQEQCGSCWAFSTTGSLEGQHFRATGDLVSLSEQQLVDCSGDYGNMGCGGGLMDNAFRYIKENGGLDTEDSYPYTAEDQDCSFNPQTIGATCTGYVDIPAGDEEALKEAIANNGPVSVAIDASHVSFQSYTSGVYDEPDCDSEMLDHGVLAVGYGTEDGKDYWLVKNSWGEDWGDQGYIKMSRNKDNQCGIATAASYPTV